MDLSSFPRPLLEGLLMEIEAELFARDEEKLSDQMIIEIENLLGHFNYFSEL